MAYEPRYQRRINTVPIQSLKHHFFESSNTSFVRFTDLMICLSGDPSTKVRGYFHSVRFADGNRSYSWAKLLKILPRRNSNP
jgi:hypothetical protein